MTMIANDNLPATVEQAVRALEGLVPPAEQARIATLSEADLSMLHFGLGHWIRNHFGLWSGNQRLLDDSHAQSIRIIQWLTTALCRVICIVWQECAAKLVALGDTR